MSDETVYKAEEKARMNGGSPTAAWLLIAAGVLLLVASVMDIQLMDYLWPGFIVVPGLALLYPAYKSTAVTQSNWGFLAIPGAILLATGSLFAAMNLVNYFEAWAYTWPLLLAAAAGGVLYMTRFDNNPELERRAHKFIRFTSMLVIGLAFFFEILVFEHFNPFFGIGLIVFGLYLLRQDRRAVVA